VGDGAEVRRNIPVASFPASVYSVFMTKLSAKEIREVARSIVAKSEGIRRSALMNEICQENQEISKKAVENAIWDLDKSFPDEIAKPSRGLFAPSGSSENESFDVGETEQVTPAGVKIKESDFYLPFAEWLRDELDEVGAAIPLGRAFLRGRFGTPDVVGTYRPRSTDIVQFPAEIVSAEIKIDPYAPVVAFGQAVAYRLFSTKTYIVMPATLTLKDKARLEALCMLFGLGLVYFNLDKKDPKFTIRMQAQRFSPDMFYVNEVAERLKNYSLELFHELFG
jgi:hypothetical protein